MSKAAYNTSLGNGLPAEKEVIGAFFKFGRILLLHIRWKFNLKRKELNLNSIN